MQLKYISIICPIYNEEKYIAKCIDSIVEQDYSKEFLEVLLVDGGSSDNTREIIAKSISDKPFIRLLDNPHRTAPYALNIGIREAKGEVIMRIDAHSAYPLSYVSTLVKYLFELNADNVGGAWNILPANDTARAVSIAAGSSHPFGVGNATYKTGAKNIMEVDTVPFGCYRRDVFERIGYFDEELTRNQDNEFNARLKNAGGKIYLIPEVAISYTARDTWRKMYRMYYQYALFSPLVNKKLGKPDSIKRIIPALFFCGLLMGAALSFISKIFLWPLLAAIGGYLLAGVSIGFTTAKRWKKPALVFCLPVTFFLMHFAYALGYIAGKYKVISGAKFSATINR
ncbi:MAG: glycosyltransferase family 2 protein [Prevotellaceae bacterium]|jgi:glycosyltransferase involved in cell wall biosynthesis|nr:glycosyltransferase family 2 protein [Prevotellaceae bacterium]